MEEITLSMKEKIKKWSRWIFFKNLNRLPEIAVIYQIRCVDSKLRPIPIHRLRVIDKDGILDIGNSANLRVRMTDFWGVAGKRKLSYSHQAGVTFSKRNYRKIFPIEGLQFRYLIQIDKSSAREAEKRELKKYINRFFELPPLNSQE